MNFRYLKIINLMRPSKMVENDYNWIKSHVERTWLHLQETDHEEKTIIYYSWSQGKKILTLPWPPSLPSQSQTNLQA